ncbi:MAG: glycosyltransferase [Planctomycetes bacterium]|nr:glycosyltransferase [Planctomycetota bacterium]
MSNHIKILIAMEGVLGGTLRHLDYLLRHADPEEFEIHLAVSAHRAPHVRADFHRWSEYGWKVHEIPMRREPHPSIDFQTLRHVVSLCHEHRFDVVHTHCAKAGFIGRLAARCCGSPTIHTPHVFPFSHVGKGLERSAYLGLERLAARWTDRFVVLSKYQKNLLIDSMPVDPARAELIPNGLLPDEWLGPGQREARKTLGLPLDGPLALFAGRFRPQKGPDILLGAAEKMRRAREEMKIAMVGEGPMENWIRSEIRSRGLVERILFRGYSDRMPLYYAASDVVVMPSRAEGMPYVLLEAKAAGRPTIATLVTGMEEFIEHGEDGFLIPPEHPGALASTLQNLLSSPERLRTAGEAARSGFRRCWEAPAAARAVFELYRELGGGAER